MKIYCHQCEKSRVIKKEEYDQRNIESYCDCRGVGSIFMQPKSWKQTQAETKKVGSILKAILR